MQPNETRNRVVTLAVLSVIFLSIISLLGWLFGWRLLTGLAPAFTTMKPNTAICLILTATALRLSKTPSSRSRHSLLIGILATLVMVTAALTLGEYFFGWNVGIDELFFRDPEPVVYPSSPGRFAPGTAVALLLTASAIFFIDIFPLISHGLTLIAILIPLVGLLGFLYRLPTVYGAGRYTSLALHTVISFIALCIGILASRPDRGLTGLITRSLRFGSQTRALIAGAVVLPILLGSSVLWGQRLGQYGAEFTLVLFSALLIVLTVALVWITGNQQFTIEVRRSASEDALRDSEERFRAMADNIPNLAFMAHADGEISWYNSRWYQYTGLDFDSLKGWGWRSAHHPSYIDAVLSRWRAALESGSTFEMEFPLRRSDGIYLWFLTRVVPVRNQGGEVIRWFGTNTNIDDKRQAENALKESEELARCVIEGSPEGVELLDETGGMLLTNRQGRTFRALRDNLARGEQVTSARAVFSAACAGQPGTFTDALGEQTDATWLETSLTPLRDTSGVVKRVLSITRDVTNMRRSEEKLAQTAKLESLGVMAGGIAHDFNNLLTGILANAGLLEEVCAPQDRELATNIVHAAERAADLTRQMLAYSGKGHFEAKAIDLSAQVRDILPLIRPVIDKNVEIKLNLEDSLPRVQADPGQMHQVTMNLIINGAESMGGRKGMVAVRTSTAEIDDAFIAQTFSAQHITAGSFVRLEVRDTGSGMNEETKSKIFDPFFTTKFTGRGLGLAAVSGIVRRHGGALRVSSVLGEGTTFEIFLPALASEKEPAAVAIETNRNNQPGHGKILVVDDELMVLMADRACLKQQGYAVLEATNGVEAVNLFRTRSTEISLIILDLTMPVMNGYEALVLLYEIRPDVKIIVCSGYSESEVTEKLTSTKVAGFLQKPYSSGTLIHKVRQVLAEHISPAAAEPNAHARQG